MDDTYHWILQSPTANDFSADYSHLWKHLDWDSDASGRSIATATRSDGGNSSPPRRAFESLNDEMDGVGADFHSIL